MIVWKRKAEITVFLSLICISVCGIILAIFSAARKHGAKMQAAALTTIGLQAAFSEYDVRLFEDFGILCVNTEYHGESGGDLTFADHVFAYINESLNENLGANLYNLQIRNVEIVNSVYASERYEFFLGLDEESINTINEQYDSSCLLISAEIEVTYDCNGESEFRITDGYSLNN